VQLISTLSRRITGQPQGRRASTRRPTTRLRPQLDALEGRVVLSTLTVTNNLAFGAGSLRAEISLAQSGDTIVFAKGIGSTIVLGSAG